MMNNEPGTPLISCLCITNNRVNYLKRAIACFQAQTYANKELVIVYRDDDPATGRTIEQINDDRIIPVEVKASADLNLGESRNLSVQRCSGDYFCVWDDDDWYHNSRLELQMNAIKQSCKPVCVLAYLFMFDKIGKQAYFSHLKMWNQTILCKKSIINRDIRYGDVQYQEDVIFLEKLIRLGCIYPLPLPQLYIYVYHGSNLWGDTNFSYFFRIAQKLSPDASQLIGEILANKYPQEKASELISSPKVLEQLKYVVSKKKRQ